MCLVNLQYQDLFLQHEKNITKKVFVIICKKVLLSFKVFQFSNENTIYALFGVVI